MKPKEPVRTGQVDLFKSRLDQIIGMKHEKVVLAGRIDWDFLAEKFGGAYSDKPGHPALSVRLMAGLAILKYADNLSDEELCARWVENPYYQYFCGEEFFQHELPFERSSLTRWRQRMGEDRRSQTAGFYPGDCRHHGGGEKHRLSHRRQTDPQGARAAGEAGEEAWHSTAPVL